MAYVQNVVQIILHCSDDSADDIWIDISIDAVPKNDPLHRVVKMYETVSACGCRTTSCAGPRSVVSAIRWVSRTWRRCVLSTFARTRITHHLQTHRVWLLDATLSQWFRRKKNQEKLKGKNQGFCAFNYTKNWNFIFGIIQLKWARSFKSTSVARMMPITTCGTLYAQIWCAKTTFSIAWLRCLNGSESVFRIMFSAAPVSTPSVMVSLRKSSRRCVTSTRAFTGCSRRPGESRA